MSTLSQDLNKLDELREAESAAKSAYDDAKDAADQWEAHCIERMEAEETESQKTRGVNWSKAETVYATVQDRAAFIKWAQESGEADEVLVELKERKALINEIVRQRLDDGQPLPPGLGMRVKQYISRRAS